MRMNGAAALIQALEDCSVEQVFGIPGVQNIGIYDALLASSIRHVLVRHEQSAVHMADGLARSTGRVGVVFATSGPGATNTVTGIATAYMDSVPLVIITGQVSTTAIGTDAFQEADITTITLPITKHSYLIKDVDDVVPSVFEAFYLASSGRPGPVLIDIPSNVASAETTYRRPQSPPQIPSYKPTIRGNDRQIRTAAEVIAASMNPIMLCGGGVVSAGASDEIRALAEYASIPVATTLLAKGVIPSSHELFLGQPGVYGSPRANAALEEADVVLAIGTRLTERITSSAEYFAPRAQIIHIDIDPAEIGKNVRADIPIVGDAAHVVQSLKERLQKLGARQASVPGDFANKAARLGGAQDLECRQDRLPVDEESRAGREVYGEEGDYDVCAELQDDILYQNTTHRVFSALSEVLSRYDDVLITTDVGQHQLWASHLLRVDRPRRFLTSGGLGTMGFGLPAALGAQIANPESLVVCISGDGSFQMSLQEMTIAAVQELPVKVVIVNNHSHGLVHQWQELFLAQRFSHTALDPVPDYVLLAQAFSWVGRSLVVAEEPEALSGCLAWLMESEGPALLEVIVPTDDLLEPMVKPGGSLTEYV